jgi:hypothetical protein
MKRRTEQNFYDLLEIKFDASAFEINRAYKVLCQLYQEDSLASYSFFSREEREEILTALNEAYSTLMDEDKRSRYDQSLKGDGLLGEEMGSREGWQRLCLTPDSNPLTNNTVLTMRNELRAMVSSIPEIQEILTQDALGGRDLKRIREKLGVTLEVVAEMTKVRIRFLRAIEEDEVGNVPSLIFLKSFLRAYAQSIGLDADIVTNHYFARMNG